MTTLLFTTLPHVSTSHLKIIPLIKVHTRWRETERMSLTAWMSCTLLRFQLFNWNMKIKSNPMMHHNYWTRNFPLKLHIKFAHWILIQNYWLHRFTAKKHTSQNQRPWNFGFYALQIFKRKWYIEATAEIENIWILWE